AAMIISLGLVVDNATVVTENALRLMGDGLPKRKAVIQGTATMSIPMLAATLTTVAAFLPMLLMVGNVGEFIRSLPIVVAITLLGSYAVAMLVVPLFCMWLLKAPAKHAAAKARPRPKPYERLLNWCLGRKLTVLGIALAAFLGALMLLPVIGSQFFPSGARDQFFVKVWMPEGSPLSATEEVSLRVEEIILGTSKLDEGGEPVERLANMVSFIGSGGPRLMLTQWLEQDYPYFAHIVVNTTSATLTDDWVEQVRREVRSIPGARIEVFPFTMGPPIDTPVAFRVIGKDAGLLRAAAEDMLAVMRRTPGALNPFSDWGASAYQVAVDVDSTAANLAGVTNAEVARTMHALLSGARLTTYREGDHQIPVVLRTIPSRRARLGELTGIFVNSRTGKVPLASLATVTPTWEPAVISRRNNVRAITVGCRVETGRLANQVASAIRPKLEAIVAGLPPGYRLEEAGEKEETTDAQAKMARAVQIAMLLIVLVLVTQYNSFLKPLVILCTLPMALIGVIVGLWITGWAMGFMAMLGVLSLFGIVINDAIVLIDFIEEKVRAGMPLRPAVVLAGRLRMKPIFLTSLTTVGGLLPLALFAGPMWAPMAWAMIFGLLFATILTLVIVPVFYVLFAERLRMQVVQPADSAAAGGV
ncbi:MAG: efflux RND transporter permease subunit, partial [Planctomycetota bacterium]